MGEIADMMLDGTLCEGCGVYLGATMDVPTLCPSCAQDRRSDGHEVVKGASGYVDAGPIVRTPAVKVQCPICGKKVKQFGLADHQRDVHDAIRGRG